MLPGQASLLRMELWIHVALIEFQPEAPQHPHPALWRCLLPWETLDMFAGQLTVKVLCTQLGGSLGFAHAAAGKERRCKSTISSQIFFNISFHRAALQLLRGTSPSLPCKAFPCGPCQRLPVQSYLLSTPQAHVTEPSAGNRTRSLPCPH